jgi:hypothetical protein
MISSLVFVVLVVAAFAAWGIWAKAHGSPGVGSRREPDSSDAAAPAPEGRAPDRSAGAGLAGYLERWVAAGLISSEQAEAIGAHERQATAARAPAGERRISLIAEALGYVGTALALAGAAVGLGQTWEDIPAWSRLAIAAGATAVLLLGGLLLLRQAEPAFRRLQSVLWLLAVGAAAWALAVLGVEFIDLDEAEPMVLLVGAGTAALAAVLWAVRRNPLQHAALFATLHVALVGVILSLPGETPMWVYALVVWALGVAWGLLGWRRALEPWWLAIALGSVGAIVGPSVGIDGYPWLLAVALATSIFLMVVSVPTGQVPLLAVGTVGTFGYVTWAVFRYFGDSLGVPLTLVVVGGVFLGLAVVAGRLTQVTRGRWRGSPRPPSAE